MRIRSKALAVFVLALVLALVLSVPTSASASGTGTPADAQGDATAQQAVTSMTGPSGTTYTIVTLGLDADLREVFSKAAGQDEWVLVQKKDAAGNVEYSLSFFGKDIPDQDAAAFAGSLEGVLSMQLPDNVEVDGEALVLRFEGHGALPATAEVIVSAGFYFSNEVVERAGAIDVYQLDPGTGEAVRIAQGKSIENGYLVFDLANTNDVILASGEVLASSPAASGGNAAFWPMATLVVAVASILAAALFLFLRARWQVKKAGTAVASVEEEDEEFRQWISEVSLDAPGEGVAASGGEPVGGLGEDEPEEGATAENDKQAAVRYILEHRLQKSKNNKKDK